MNFGSWCQNASDDLCLRPAEPPPRLTHDSWPFFPVGADEAERKAARLVSWLLAVFPRRFSAAIAKATFTSEALLMH